MYQPFLGCNEPVDIYSLKYPLYATVKKDGVRGIAREGDLRTRSQKSASLPLIKNKQIQDEFRLIKSLTKRINITFDFELYIRELPLNEIIMFTNTEDITSREHYNKIKKQVKDLSQRFLYYLSLPDSLEFYLFDSVINTREQSDYLTRMTDAREILKGEGLLGSDSRISSPLIQIIESPKQLELTYEYTIEQGFEGLVLHAIGSPYKYGRSTLKEQYFLKLKPSSTFEATILEINERMMNFNESQTSSSGYAFKASNQENKEGCGVAATATVSWEGKTFKITLKGTEAERAEMWDNREKYVGRKVLFSGMAYGMKDVPRFPKFEKLI